MEFAKGSTDEIEIAVEIQRQNRRLRESINYAKRIQGAIIPDQAMVNRLLPDSFIFYKPRDIVSGDFPWFTQLRGDIFLAAVDCTGHGVPGALLSLVGHFLLNDIVRSRKITDVGKILDLLDECVSTTLHPDQATGSRDGMDISLCKIDLGRKTVEYAGAHRPLYVMRGGALEVVKGDKFPIGGGVFKNQTSFTNNRIALTTGDSIYFCTDGYCDQFGGPEGRKFGTKRFRDLMTEIHQLPMREASQVFESRWHAWKGNRNQTDDVLLMGIKLG